MNFFRDRKRDFSSAVINSSHRPIFEFLRQLYTDAIQDLNLNLDKKHSQLSISAVIKTNEDVDEKGSSVERFFVHNSLTILSVRYAHQSKIETFLLPAAQMEQLPSTEYPSRLRFNLSWKESAAEGAWTLDGVVPGENDIRLVVLASINDLMRYTVNTISERAPRLRVGDLSLTTGLRDLLLEKSRLAEMFYAQQETLQANVAREMHDTVLADLLSLSREIASGKPLVAASICAVLDEIASRIRVFCQDFSSRDLQDWGLSEALGVLVERTIERTGKNIQLRSNLEEERELPFEVSLHIFRIAQEALNNALKHSQATKIQLTLKQSRQELYLCVKDNGVGFIFPISRTADEKSGGLGLGGLKERSDLLTSLGFPSIVTIDSQPGAGSSVVIRVDTSSARN